MSKEPEWATEAYPTTCPMCGDVVYLRSLRAPNHRREVWPLDRTGKNHFASCDGFRGWISGDANPSARKTHKKWVADVRVQAEQYPKAFVDRDEAVRKMKEE